MQQTDAFAALRSSLRNLTRPLGLGSFSVPRQIGARQLLTGGSRLKADEPGESKSMSEPNPWNDVLSDAYAVLGLLGVGGYIVAMLAL
jgi:hypothetical protein